MAEREFRTTPQWPIATTPLSGEELVEIWKDGKQYYVPFSELGGTPAAHQGSHQRGGSDEIGTLDNDAYGIPYLDADGLIDTRVSDASTTKKGKVQLATDGEESATKAVTGTDARLSDARAPTAHASQHIAGTDVIADATVSNSGLMSATDKVKADATIPENIPTADQKAALVGTSGTPSATNEYVTDSDGRLPTAEEKAALVGTSGTPSAINPFVTTTDPRLDVTTDALVRAWASFFSVFSEEQPTGQTSRLWRGLASHDGDLYAADINGINGDIYKMDSSGVFQPTGQTPRYWFALASHDGDLYAAVQSGDVYKMDSAGIFQPTGQTSRDWRGLASHDGDLYAAVDGGDIYLLTTSNPSVNISKSDYTVPISSSFPINGRKVYRRTSAYDGNPVTITPPSGATFEGRASIALYGQYSYVELERISATVFAIKDLRDEYVWDSGTGARTRRRWGQLSEKEIIGTTAATGGADVTVAHGINAGNIKGANGQVFNTMYSEIIPMFFNGAGDYTLSVSFFFDTINLTVRNSTTLDQSCLSQPFVVTAKYIEW